MPTVAPAVISTPCSLATRVSTRLPGAHCYEVFAGSEQFAALCDEEPGTFFLTDFLARHFDALVWQGLGLDRHPELRDMYFGNYRRVVLLSQSEDEDVVAAGRRGAELLGLAFEHRHVGRAGLADAVPVGVQERAERAHADRASASSPGGDGVRGRSPRVMA